MCSVVTIGIRRSRKQPDDVAAGRAAEDSVFVLKADDIGVGEIEKIGSPQVRVDLLLFDFEPHFGRIVVTGRDVVDRHDEAVRPGILGRDRGAKVVSEGRDSAFPRQIVADECDFLNLAVPFHDGHAKQGARRQEVKSGRDDPAVRRSNVTAGIIFPGELAMSAAVPTICDRLGVQMWRTPVERAVKVTGC